MQTMTLKGIFQTISGLHILCITLAGVHLVHILFGFTMSDLFTTISGRIWLMISASAIKGISQGVKMTVHSFLGKIPPFLNASGGNIQPVKFNSC